MLQGPGADERGAPSPVARLPLMMAVIGVVVTAVGWLAVDARATYGARTTADEPQYLLTALSLGEDLDLDISDEIEDGRFGDFHEVPLDPQTQVRSDGSQVSPHDPLLPLVLALPMVAGGWVAAKMALAAIGGALAAAILWVAVRRFGTAPGVTALVVLAFAVTPPLTSYGSQVYPELPAALAVTVAIGAAMGPLDRRNLAVSGLALVALPWLAVKYTPLAAVLGLCLLVRLSRERRWGALSGLAGAMVGAGVVYLALHRVLYDGWTVYASGDHFVGTGELSVVGTDPDWAGRSARLLGLVVDRGFGLAAWSPVYLLAVAALGAWLAARPRGWWIVAAPLAVGWLNATFVALTMHGWWWPGRQVVVVLPAVVLMTAWWASRVRAVVPLVVISAAVGLFGWLWLVAEASSGRLTLIFDFEQTANPLYRAWRLVLPDGRRELAADPLLSVVWWVVVAALLAIGVWSVRRARRRTTAKADAEADETGREAVPSGDRVLVG